MKLQITLFKVILVCDGFFHFKRTYAYLSVPCVDVFVFLLSGKKNTAAVRSDFHMGEDF